MITAVLSIGSNIEPREKYLDMVFQEFSTEIIARSSLYVTPAWGEQHQEDFLNAVIIIRTDSTPLELLVRGQQLENKAHRHRLYKWGPRTLDVDIVDVSDEGIPFQSATERLQVPHPWATKRAFVLIPWLEADPAAKIHGMPLAHFISSLATEEVEQIRKKV